MTEGEKSAALARSASSATSNMSGKLDGMEQTVKRIQSETAHILGAATRIDEKSRSLESDVRDLAACFDQSADNLKHTETCLASIAEGGRDADENRADSPPGPPPPQHRQRRPSRGSHPPRRTRFADLTEAVDQGALSLEDAFDRDYKLIQAAIRHSVRRYVEVSTGCWGSLCTMRRLKFADQVCSACRWT